jgi:hypothetical protein
MRKWLKWSRKGVPLIFPYFSDKAVWVRWKNGWNMATPKISCIGAALLPPVISGVAIIVPPKKYIGYWYIYISFNII